MYVACGVSLQVASGTSRAGRSATSARGWALCSGAATISPRLRSSLASR